MKLSPLMRSWLFAALTVITVGYLVAAWFMTRTAAANRMCEGVLITVHDTSEIHFVTPQELSAELGDFPKRALDTPLANIDIDSIERMFNLFDKIERVNVNVLSSGKLLIDVWPMRPVARIFDSAGHSYYINRSGKRIAAEPGYFLDVPVVKGDFSPSFPVTSLIPLIDYIEANPEWGEAISMIEVRSSGDIILVPIIRGHVINMGDTTDLPDKFHRLKLMYSKVMSSKGWDFYKEISVKWRGQVVGVRRHARTQGPEYILDEHNEEESTVSTAELDEGAPSTVSAEKPIPAVAKNRSEAHKPDSTKAIPKASSSKSNESKKQKTT